MTTITVHEFNCLCGFNWDTNQFHFVVVDRIVVIWPQVNKLPHFTPLAGAALEKMFNYFANLFSTFRSASGLWLRQQIEQRACISQYSDIRNLIVIIHTFAARNSPGREPKAPLTFLKQCGALLKVLCTTKHFNSRTKWKELNLSLSTCWGEKLCSKKWHKSLSF